VKQTLDKSHVGQASDKAASVRDLHRTSGPIPNQFNLEARKDLAAFSAIAGILCERSDWSTPLGDAFDACIADNKGPRGLDLGCALSDGSFELDWRGGEFTIDKSQTANALTYFAMRLLRRWQAMATVPAIDYSAYEVPCSTNPGRFRPDEVSPSGFGVSRPDMAAQRHEQRFESARRTASYRREGPSEGPACYRSSRKVASEGASRPLLSEHLQRNGNARTW